MSSVALELSVIVCAWNPRPEFIERTLSALESQSLALSRWEFVLIDNNSEPALSSRALRAPSNGRIVREARAGLTHARLRGIEEAGGDLLIFVDDDNVLASDYLERALGIAERHPRLGVFGGRSLPEFEVSPPDWMKPFWANLALHDFKGDRITNQRDHCCFPCGAGMCMRREVAVEYANKVRPDSMRKALDRTGTTLTSAGDTDIVLSALAAGWGVGRFEFLSLTHLIPKERLTLEYHCRLAQGMGISIGQLNGRESPKNPLTLLSTLRALKPVLLATGPARKVRWAAFLAYRQGLREGWAHRLASKT